MSGPPEAQIPFNFFAGTLPTEPVELAWESGYLFVITSITLTLLYTTGEEYVELVDAEGNKRLSVPMHGANSTYPQSVFWRGEMVMGPNEGATIVINSGTGYASIDGYALLPLDSPIW